MREGNNRHANRSGLCALELYINTGTEALLLTVEANINKMTISKQSSVCDLECVEG